MSEEKEEKLETVREQNQQIRDLGEAMLEENEKKYHIQLLTIIGEVEGHECLPNNSKTTKYEHILPKLAVIEDSRETDGLLILLNTVGGDVEAGLAIAEMIASLSKPTVSLVLGGGHSIGVPMAVSADYSFIVPSALPWSSTRSGATACLSVSCRPIGTWKKSRTGSPDLLQTIQI